MWILHRTKLVTVPAAIAIDLDFANFLTFETKNSQQRTYTALHPLLRYFVRHWSHFPGCDVAAANLSMYLLKNHFTLKQATLERFNSRKSFQYRQVEQRRIAIFPWDNIVWRLIFTWAWDLHHNHYPAVIMKTVSL